MISKEYIDQYKKNLIIAYPIALSQLGHIAVGVADSVMVGSLGGHFLAAATVAFSVYIPFMMLGIGISYGVSPLIAKADGEGNTQEVTSVFKHSIVMNIATGVILCIILYFGSFMLMGLRQPEGIVGDAIPFFEILALSTIPLMVFQSFRQFAEGLAITRQAMYISIAGNVINIILNYIFIHGKFGLPSYGINGAGYATLTARIFMAIAMIAFVLYYKKISIYVKGFASIKYSTTEYKRILKKCLPVGIQLSIESAAFGFAAIMVGWVGASEIAAHHVALNMAAITYMAASGIAAAGTVRVGNEFGRRDYKSVRAAGFGAFHIVIIFMGLSAIGFVLLRHSLPQLYIDEENIEQIAISLLLISAFFQLSDGIQVVGLGVLRGIGDVKVPTAIALFSYWFIGLPVGYILAFTFKMGAEGVWYGLLTGLTIAAFFLFIRFNIKSKVLLTKSNVNK